MARPAVLQFLRHGFILSRRLFPRFVETWNWLVGAFDNMKGDADVNPLSGRIKIDRTNPDAPIVRFVNLPNQGGGGETGEVTVVGTDGSSATGNKITIASATDANVTASVTQGSDGGITVTVGVYYL